MLIGAFGNKKRRLFADIIYIVQWACVPRQQPYSSWLLVGRVRDGFALVIARLLVPKHRASRLVDRQRYRRLLFPIPFDENETVNCFAQVRLYHIETCGLQMPALQLEIRSISAQSVYVFGC